MTSRFRLGGVHEHGALPGEDRDHRCVDLGDRREHQGVRRAEEGGEPMLDVKVGTRVAEQS
jgi:hypothetical protein